MAALQPRIIGTGWSVPKKIRLNDDPIFDWLKSQYPNQNLFKGYKMRHVLDTGEDLMSIMIPAAKMALKKAGKKPGDIDILIGLASISTYVEPNDLTRLHKELGLPARTWVIPVGDDFSNFASSLIIADGLIKAGRAKNILICIGSNWTSNVDYHTTQAISAGDGAGAAVVSMSGDKSKWYVADQCTVTDSEFFGTMFTEGGKKMIANLNANPPLYGCSEVYCQRSFTITPEGILGFTKFGTQIALTSVIDLLKKNKITAADVSFMPHQTSSVLIDYWLDKLNPKPAQLLTTITEIANITVATHSFNLAWFEGKGIIKKNKLVMLALGPDMHANAMLLKRD
jgi:3-oxoacyl-[acyl-carrier-protein] synthase III